MKNITKILLSILIVPSILMIIIFLIAFRKNSCSARNLSNNCNPGYVPVARWIGPKENRIFICECISTDDGK